MNEKILNIVFAVGAILMLISSVLVMENVIWGKYVFATGVALFVISRSKMIYTGSDFRLKRLTRLYLLSSILLVVSATLQFKGNNSWIVLLLIVAISEFYTSMRATSYEKSIKEDSDKKNADPSEKGKYFTDKSLRK